MARTSRNKTKLINGKEDTRWNNYEDRHGRDTF